VGVAPVISAAFGIAILLGLNACGPVALSPHEPPAAMQKFKPTAWLAESLAKRDAPPAEPDPALPPVVLVHGIDGCARDMARLARGLQAAGRVVHAIDLVPNNGSAPLEDLSAQLQSFIDDHVADGVEFDLVGYSMGGIVSRHYVQERGGHARVRRLVTISSPHHGTLVAWLRRGAGACQMRIGSPFLARLATSDSMENLPPTTSFLTSTDLIIVPFTSSTLPGAENVRLFGWGHFTGIIEPHAIRRVVAALL
jgi:triacylglycerol lipase